MLVSFYPPMNETAFISSIITVVSLSDIVQCYQLRTLFTVWFSIFQVESVVSYWLLTVSAQKTVDMPCLFEGIYHLLDKNANNVVSWWHETECGENKVTLGGMLALYIINISSIINLYLIKTDGCICLACQE